MSQYSFRSNNSNPIISILFTALIFVALYYIVGGIFKALTWAAPVLLIATLIIDHKVVLDYFKSLWNMLKATPFFGLLCCGLSFFGAPVIIFYLFGKALMKRQAKKFQSEFENRYNQSNTNQDVDNEGFTPYEEVNDNLLDNDWKSESIKQKDEFFKKR